MTQAATTYVTTPLLPVRLPAPVVAGSAAPPVSP